MRIGVYAAQTIQADVCIDLSGIDCRVTEEVLHNSQIRSAFEQVRSKCMTQGVRGDRLIDACLDGMLHDDAVHRATG